MGVRFILNVGLSLSLSHAISIFNYNYIHECKNDCKYNAPASREVKVSWYQ